MRQLVIVFAVAVAAMAGPQAAVAGKGDAVDPALMQPSLNPTFAPWECWRAGAQIVCEGTKTESYTGLPVDFLACDVGPIYSSGTFTATARRIGDLDGRALQTAFRDRYVEYFSTDPGGANPRLRSIGRLQHTFEYGVPGDGSTVSETLSGLQISVTGPGVGVVFHDVGTLAFDSEGNLIRTGGVHPWFDPDEWAETHDRICAAFEPGS
jgi:hypothetical protein